MTNTTLSEVITATDLDLYHRNLTRSRKGAVQRKISLQIQFIRDLYKNFSLAVVAGGAPMNHKAYAPAADIDIFTADADTARLIAQKYAFGPTESIDMSSSAAVGTHYSSSINSLCLKFLARIPDVSGVKLVPVNVIVIKTPEPAPKFVYREQVVAMVALSFPNRMLRFAYIADDNGDLLILSPRTAAGSIPGTESRVSDKYLDKYFKKAILLSGNPNGRAGVSSDLGGSTLLTKIFRPDYDPGMNEYLGYIAVDTSIIFGHIFRGSVVKVSSRNCILPREVSHPIFITTYGYVPDSEVISRNVGTSKAYQEGSSQRARLYSGTSASFSATMSTLRNAYDSARLRARSRSPDWISAWGIAPTMQPSGGQDQVTSWTIAGSQAHGAIGSGIAYYAGEVSLSRSIPTTPPIGGASFF